MPQKVRTEPAFATMSSAAFPSPSDTTQPGKKWFPAEEENKMGSPVLHVPARDCYGSSSLGGF
jgi:hypothetical protein